MKKWKMANPTPKRILSRFYLINYCGSSYLLRWFVSYLFQVCSLKIIIILLHGLGPLTCSGIDALPSFPGASTFVENILKIIFEILFKTNFERYIKIYIYIYIYKNSSPTNSLTKSWVMPKRLVTLYGVTGDRLWSTFPDHVLSDFSSLWTA